MQYQLVFDFGATANGPRPVKLAGLVGYPVLYDNYWIMYKLFVGSQDLAQGEAQEKLLLLSVQSTQQQPN
jgi:hypothetical protein